jgi:hypothetical protein
MIIKEMFYIPIKLKPELARASMTTSWSNLYPDHPMNISGKFGSIQRRRFKCEKLTDGRWTPDDGRLAMTKAHMAYDQVS